jgi:hypothetical protein
MVLGCLEWLWDGSADLVQIFNIDFCGDWAGGVWGSTTCAQINPSCSAYVASQPQSFVDVSLSFVKAVGRCLLTMCRATGWSTRSRCTACSVHEDIH